MKKKSDITKTTIYVTKYLFSFLFLFQSLFPNEYDVVRNVPNRDTSYTSIFVFGIPTVSLHICICVRTAAYVCVYVYVSMTTHTHTHTEECAYRALNVNLTEKRTLEHCVVCEQSMSDTINFLLGKLADFGSFSFKFLVYNDLSKYFSRLNQ